jgi:predicted dehydrogenase
MGTKSMDQVRVAGIGCGSMAMGHHYPSVAEHPGAEIVALCDLDPQRLQRAGERLGVSHLTRDARETFTSPEVDAVYILMPPHQLFDLTIQAFKAGKHVFLEKPPGITADQTRQMARAAANAGKHGMVGFNRRFLPLLVEAKRRVEERGPLVQIVCTFYKNHPPQGPYYDGAVDILTSDAIHAIDTLRWLGGPIAQLASVCDTTPDAVYENTFGALARFESGAVGHLLLHWAVGARRHTFELHTRGLSAFVDGDVEARFYADGSVTPEVVGTRECAGSDEFRVYYGYQAENRYFVDCLLRGEAPQPSLADATETMELVERLRYGAWPKCRAAG